MKLGLLIVAFVFIISFYFVSTEMKQKEKNMKVDKVVKELEEHICKEYDIADIYLNWIGYNKTV